MRCTVPNCSLWNTPRFLIIATAFRHTSENFSHTHIQSFENFSDFQFYWTLYSEKRCFVHWVIFYYGSKYGSGRFWQGSQKFSLNFSTPKSQEKVLKSYDFRTFYGCGGRTRTYDLRVMSCKKSNFPWHFKGFSHFFTENPEVINPIKSTQSIACWSRMGQNMGQLCGLAMGQPNRPPLPLNLDSWHVPILFRFHFPQFAFRRFQRHF